MFIPLYDNTAYLSVFNEKLKLRPSQSVAETFKFLYLT